MPLRLSAVCTQGRREKAAEAAAASAIIRTQPEDAPPGIVSQVSPESCMPLGIQRHCGQTGLARPQGGPSSLFASRLRVHRNRNWSALILHWVMGSRDLLTCHTLVAVLR